MLMHGEIRNGRKLVNLMVLIKRDDTISDLQGAIKYYDKAFIPIEQKIKTFANFHYITHVSGTNVIYLSTYLERDKIRSLVNRILKIKNVDGLNVSTNYIEELKEAMEMHDFFKVVAFSSTLIETYGKQILIKHFGEKNQDRDHDRIHNLTLNATAIMLYSSGLIDKPLFDDIDYVRKKRNILFIHRGSDPNQITVLSKERVKTLEDLANKAIRSVSLLIAKLPN
jgi:hypothetical protein